MEADARGGSFKLVEHLLHIEDLKVVFRTAGKDLPAVDKISMSLSAGEHIALLGETGCGKSVLAMAVFGLLHHPFQGSTFQKIERGCKKWWTLSSPKEKVWIKNLSFGKNRAH